MLGVHGQCGIKKKNFGKIFDNLPKRHGKRLLSESDDDGSDTYQAASNSLSSKSTVSRSKRRRGMVIASDSEDEAGANAVSQSRIELLVAHF